MTAIQSSTFADGGAPRTAIEIRAQVQLIQEIMRDIMKENEHFGKISGCPKPSLWKPGAEKIMMAFRIAAEPEIIDLSTSDAVRYRVNVRGLSASGHSLGVGVGECSSDEDKYRWREAVCAAEYDDTREDYRREKWKRGAKEPILQVRTNPADLANTILKMAKKRALIDMVLTVTAASDIFTQDIEDAEDVERINAGAEAPKELKQPRAKTTPATTSDAKTTTQPDPLPAGQAYIPDVLLELADGGKTRIRGNVMWDAEIKGNRYLMKFKSETPNAQPIVVSCFSSLPDGGIKRGACVEFDATAKEKDGKTFYNAENVVVLA